LDIISFFLSVLSTVAGIALAIANAMRMQWGVSLSDCRKRPGRGEIFRDRRIHAPNIIRRTDAGQSLCTETSAVLRTANRVRLRLLAQQVADHLAGESGARLAIGVRLPMLATCADPCIELAAHLVRTFDALDLDMAASVATHRSAIVEVDSR
jgi:hypothetical protein